MDEHLTPLEAWQDFWKTVVEGMDKVPNELRVANSTANGNVMRNGKKIGLGPARIARLLNKYAPGKYKFYQGQPYFLKA